MQKKKLRALVMGILLMVMGFNAASLAEAVNVFDEAIFLELLALGNQDNAPDAYGFALVINDENGQTWMMQSLTLNLLYDVSGETDRLESISLNSRTEDFTVFYGFTKYISDPAVADAWTMPDFLFKSYIADPDKTEFVDVEDNELFESLAKEFMTDPSMEHFDTILERVKQAAQ
jgi:hypothetical protein